jgi:hypothetical protein
MEAVTAAMLPTIATTKVNQRYNINVKTNT